MTQTMTSAMGLTDKDLITAIVSQFFILDYGFISEINADGTVNVIHAKRPVTTDGKVLDQMETTGLELLTISAGNFSLKIDIKKGDHVLLLGLKNYIERVEDVTQAEVPESFIHYTRETMKALPLSVFSSEAKVKIQAEGGDLSVQTEKKIKLNGDSKQLVTWAELNQALSTFLTQLTTALTTTPILGNGVPQAVWSGLPTSIDISGAKTTTVVTGG